MQLFYTGSDTLDGLQTSPIKSIGGYKSSSPVPNGSLNRVFDDISNYTLKNKIWQIRGIVLKNTSTEIKNTLKMNVIYDKKYNVLSNECEFEFGFVELTTDGAMEKLINPYSIPYYAEFVKCEARKSDGILKITSGGEIGDTVTILGVTTAALTSTSKENVVDSIIQAFSASTLYKATKKSIEEVYFEAIAIGNNDGTYNLTTSGTTASSEPLVLLNGLDNSVLLKNTFAIGATLGIWIKREVKENNPNTQYNRSYDQVNQDDLNGVVPLTLERTTINFNWL